MALRSRDLQLLEDNWRWFLALGVGLVVLGLVALGLAFAVTLASVMFFGFLLLAGGGLEIAHAFSARRWSGFFLQLVLGILYLISGGYMLTEPLAASMVLTVVLGLSILSTGVSRMALGYSLRGVGNWVWILVSGIVSLLVGGMILARWPQSSLWVIGLFVAIELLLNGAAWIVLGLTARTVNRGWVALTTPGRR